MNQPASCDSERRQHQRFTTRGDAYTVLHSDIPRLGQIIDISRGGLSFRYVDGSGIMSSQAALDIFLLNKPVLMKGVPVKSCCDFCIDTERPDPDETVRRCCVEFVALEPGQASALDELIAHHTDSDSK